MPAKKNTKSRVSKTSAKKSGFKFKWWMGLGLVVVVALIGIVVLRYSNAASGFQTWTGADSEWVTGTTSVVVYPGSAKPVTRTTDPTLPTPNKTVIKAYKNINPSTGDQFYILPQNQNIDIKKGQTLGYCVYFKLLSPDLGDVVRMDVVGKRSAPDVDPNSIDNKYSSTVLSKDIPYNQGEVVESGYRRFCATSVPAYMDSLVVGEFIFTIESSDQEFNGYIWKVERYIQGPFK